MVGKKEISYSICSLVLIGIFIIVAFSGTSLARTNYDMTKTIDLNKFFNVPIIEAKAGEVLNVEFQVTSGSDIDVLLMTPSDFADYQNAIKNSGPIKYIAVGSVLKSNYKKYTYTFVEGGDYQLVFDNTDVPKSGGSPLNQVEMNLKVSVSATPLTPEPTGDIPYSVTPKASGFEAILAAFVIVTLALRRK
ncbi:MAG: emp24/gp25L/p24 family protein [Candidatus Methanoperedens sp.]|nr:emp24/gp25L/p24 family protein [Candidatus Methanoperedens sp.]